MRTLLRSFTFAWHGLCYAWKTQQNFRIESTLGLAALVVAIYLKTGLVPITICIMLVLALELINSSIEALTDLNTQRVHPLAKIAKDSAAAAVLIASFFSVAVGVLVLGPALLKRIFS